MWSIQPGDLRAIEARGVGALLKQIKDELEQRSHAPLPARPADTDWQSPRAVDSCNPGSHGVRCPQTYIPHIEEIIWRDFFL
jgi:hypothetical protein